MKNRSGEDLKKSFMGSAGWLFADLLLALAMLFLIANSVSQPKPIVHITPTATATATATALPPRLEQNYHRFSITIDPGKLLNNDPAEKANVIRQVKAQSFLHNRTVGLVIVYGGAPTVNDISTATSIADNIYSILIGLGKHDTTFGQVSKYDPLYLLQGDPTVVKLDMFLFAT